MYSNSLFSQSDYQLNEHEISFGINYNKPLNKLGWVYKNSVGFQLGFNWMSDDGDNVVTKKGIGFDFLEFKPASDTFYYMLNSVEYGVALFSDYQQYGLTFHFEKEKAYNRIHLSAGFDAGLAFVMYTSQYKDVDFDIFEENIEGKLKIAPVMSIGYSLTDNILFSASGKYNTLLSLGSTDPNSVNYNSNAGSFYHFLALDIKIHYAF